jgi:hypothetical protein
MKTLRQTVIDNIKLKRQRILEGNINCIPSPFVRFRSEFPGIEQGQYITVTAPTKGAKSQFTYFTMVFEPLLYAYNTGKVDVKYIIFPLEETPERITQRFMSYLLCKLSGNKLRYSPSQLRSVTEALPQEVIDILESDSYKDILEYYENHIIFSSESNPTGIFKACKKYAEDNGEVEYATYKIKDDLGREQEVKGFKSYIPNNPNEYVIILIDTLNLIDTEKGMTLKQSMDKMSEYLAKYLRNRYNMTPIIIQQQSVEAENNDAYKIGKIRPSIATMGDSKYSARDSQITLGIFSPFKHGLQEYMGYDVTKFKDNIRFLEVLSNRDGNMGGIIALFFDGATCQFNELPRAENKNELEEVYRYIYSLHNKNKSFFAFTYNKIKKLFKT